MDVADLIEDHTSRTLLELDRQYGHAKGTAFRAFKRLSAELVEGRHFASCTHAADPSAFATLHAAGRLYPTTVTAIVFSAAGCRRLAALLKTR